MAALLGTDSSLHGLKAFLGEPWAAYADQRILGNTLLDCTVALAVFFAFWGAIWVFKRIVVHRLHALAKRTSSDFDDFLVGEIGRIRWWFFAAVSLYAAAHYLTLPPKLDRVLWVVFVSVVTVRTVLFVQGLVAYGVERSYFREHAREPASVAAVGNIIRLLKAILWLGAGVFLLDNLGFDITTAVAGLGIGGIAVAIAAQAILGDLFSSFSIYIDKPFRIGDFIVVGDLMGTVENIGLKTTRLRSLSGEQLVFSNADLTASRIRNFKQMQERRVVFKIGVLYETTPDQARRIPEIVREVFQTMPELRLDRVHFASFGDFALIYEIVYFVASPDYNVYMDFQQRINLALKERFDAAGIAFAYPTQTLYVVPPPPAAGGPGTTGSPREAPKSGVEMPGNAV